jgi:hypothetical protein
MAVFAAATIAAAGCSGAPTITPTTVEPAPPPGVTFDWQAYVDAITGATPPPADQPQTWVDLMLPAVTP